MSHYSAICLGPNEKPSWMFKTTDEIFDYADEYFDYVRDVDNVDEHIKRFLDYLEKNFGRRINDRCFEVNLSEFRAWFRRKCGVGPVVDYADIDTVSDAMEEITEDYGDFPIVAIDCRQRVYPSFYAFLFDNFFLGSEYTYVDKATLYIYTAYDFHCPC